MGKTVENHGDLVAAPLKILESKTNFEDLRDNRSLFVFPSAEKAVRAWENAGR
jgi:hypothetical protein